MTLPGDELGVRLQRALLLREMLREMTEVCDMVLLVTLFFSFYLVIELVHPNEFFQGASDQL
jgi:hypothetical protein